MSLYENPFTPEFGIVPDVMAGRELVLSEMRRCFLAKRRDPSLTTVLIGARGTGKTTLLSCIRDVAEESGWIAVGITALPGMLEETYDQAVYRSSHLLDPDSTPRLTSVTVGPVSAGWDSGAQRSEGWRTRMERLLDRLREQGVGLLVTVDEVQSGLDEMVKLVAVYQHLITAGFRISLIMAGLPYHVHQLLGDKSVSFLRRATQRQLNRISDADVSFALRTTAEGAGKRFDDDALAACVDASQGFAYMIQLVGYRSWIESTDNEVIDLSSAKRGIEAARSDITERVLLQTWRELSEGDRRFLRAMLEDPVESRVADIASRLGVSSSYASSYRRRLLAAGVISERGRGVVAIELPGLRELLEENADLRDRLIQQS